MVESTGPLGGVRVLDLSRVLAGPVATQLLGDLGADVIKVERPRVGDDTRHWGPPWLAVKEGSESPPSAYYLSANRNKRSIAVDLKCAEGQDIVRRLALCSDVVVENFKVGDLARLGLDHAALSALAPALIYCSISGFGQTGPLAGLAGYDFLVQGMGGIMSLTGDPDGPPMKVGVAVADVVCGLYAATAILAALRHRDATGEGQHIDLGLLDTQVAWLVNQGLSYLTCGTPPARLGNAHPNIVPYQVFPSRDGHFILAVGNDAQFRRFVEFAGLAHLADDPRFADNPSRVCNRLTLVPMLEAACRQHPTAFWLESLQSLAVPCAPVNDLREVFSDAQIRHRGMRVEMPYPQAQRGSVELIGNPIHFSRTPVDYRRPPPALGEHTDEVLEDVLGLTPEQRTLLRRKNVI
ncbi:MAG: CoA transferase [Rhodospirillales bacterium]|nr:CoA transferase [Rhodospirillales bacterium]